MVTTRIQIGSCQLDLANNNLECSRGSITHLTQKSCEILNILMQNQGELVSRQSLIESVWDGNHLIGEKRLNDEIWKIRGILTEAGASEVAIKTIPRKGYVLLVPQDVSEKVDDSNVASGVVVSDVVVARSNGQSAWATYTLMALVPLLAFAVHYHFTTIERLNVQITAHENVIREQQMSRRNAANFFVQLFNVSDKPALSLDDIRIRKEFVKNADNKLTSYAGDKATYSLLLHSLGKIYFEIGGFQEAEDSIARALEIKSEIFGEDSWEYFISLAELAEIQWAAVKPEQSRTSYLKALDIAETGEFEPYEIAKIMNGLGVLLMTHIAEYEESERYLLKALALRQVEFGNFHEHVASSLENLGYLYSSVGRLSEAAPMYEQAYDIRVKLNGMNSPRVARILTNLADVFLRMGDYVTAIDLSKKVDAIYAAVHGEDYFARGVNFVTLAEAYLKMEQISEAQNYANQSLEILLKDQRKTSMAARHLGYAYMILGDVNDAIGDRHEAVDYFEKGFYSFNEVYGSKHPKTLEAKARLDEVAPPY